MPARPPSRWRQWLARKLGGLPAIPDTLWAHTLQQHTFLQRLTTAQSQQLRLLCQHFLQRKQFTGVQGLVIDDAMALSIAAQACVLLLPWGSGAHALRWYSDFIGIVVYPDGMLAHRTVQDAAGVVHHYEESLLGEAMQGGPVTLSWSAESPTDSDLPCNSNVVIHEFAHKLDMANAGADGCPPLPAGFLGYRHAATAKAHWAQVWLAAYENFVDAVTAHERFDQPAPWLDPYAATDPAEFFAVACEAYWIAPQDFAQHLPTLTPLMDALFQCPFPSP